MITEASARIEAHKFFDELWQHCHVLEPGWEELSARERRRCHTRGRRRAYAWLAYNLGVDVFHIREADVATCRKVIEISRSGSDRIVAAWWKARPKSRRLTNA